MAVFKIGQRVRIVRSGAFPNLIGTEATIVPRTPYENSISHYHYTIRADADGARYGAETYHLQPIQPEGNRIITWEECTVWQPEHIRETA